MYNISTNIQVKTNKILGYLKKYDAAASNSSLGAISAREVYRHIALWFCRDLTPFETVDHHGLKEFFGKKS